MPEPSLQPSRPLPPSQMPRARVPAAETPRSEGLMGLSVAVVVVVALYLAREVLVPITLAVLLSFVLAPLVHLLRRIHVPRIPAVLLSVLAALTVILMLGGLIGEQLAELAHDIPQYQSTIERKVDSVRGFYESHLTAVRSRLGAAMPGSVPARAAGAASSAAAPSAQQAPAAAQDQGSPLALIQRVLAPVLSPIETLGVVFIVAIFILMQQEDLRDRLIRLFGSSDLHRTTLAIDDAAHRLSRYFLTQLAVNAGFGVIVGSGLMLIGVPNPILWGVLGALLRFVPYIGSLIAAVLPVALAAAVDPGWSKALWTAALFLGTETVVGQAVEPLLYGHSTGLSPIAVIVVAIFWSWIWGPIGLILSTPMTLCLVVLGRHVKRLEFIDVMLGDRPALTPIESFYQRMLAGDPDEVQEQAELLLKSRSLSSYYDDVALKALQLAALDVQRSVLTPEQVEALRTSVAELVTELDVHDDADPVSPPPETGVSGAVRADRVVGSEPAPRGNVEGSLPPAWQGEAAVLCVAGRGALDEAAAAMLAQLLRKHGLGAKVVPYHAVSRASIHELDVSGVAMVCISYLELPGNSSHLRYLVRRMRARAPAARLLVGLWPTAEQQFSDEDLRAELRADVYAETLRAAVTACLAVSQEEGQGVGSAAA